MIVIEVTLTSGTVRWVGPFRDEELARSWISHAFTVNSPEYRSLKMRTMDDPEVTKGMEWWKQ